MSATIDTNMEGAMLTIDQAATYLSIPRRPCTPGGHDGAGFGPPAVKLGGCLRYRRSDLDAWVDEHLEQVQ